MPSLLDKVTEQEAKNKDRDKKKRKESVASQIAKNEGVNEVRKEQQLLGQKDKQISAKVNEVSYDLFTQINKKQGLSNNSALNMLINKYNRENKGILDES